jgi:NADPH-dependent glutamate synthase beta subunit-like oxidoreductase
LERHTGIILSKNGALLVLADESNSVWYQLDDQGQASKFLGKRVVVFGKLDTSTDVIHVLNIRKIKT